MLALLVMLGTRMFNCMFHGFVLARLHAVLIISLVLNSVRVEQSQAVFLSVATKKLGKAHKCVNF